jgi:phytanoyl-CoA hydroxylase
MHVIPGSHKLGPMPHYHDRDCQLPDDRIDVDADVVVPLKPGGVLFFSGLIHHGTPPNQSAARRRAVQLHFAGADVRRIDAKRHAELFHEDPDDPRYAGCVMQHGLRPIPVSERRF